MDHPEPLFHVTFARSLPGIAKKGLRPGQGRAIGGAVYDKHRAGAIFLTDGDGVHFWAEKAEQWAEHSADNPHAEGLTPVVLRIHMDPDLSCEVDEIGTRDASGIAYRCMDAIEPDDIEVWDGQFWFPIEDHDEVDASEAYDLDEDEYGEEIAYFLPDSPLIPGDDDLYEE